MPIVNRRIFNSDYVFNMRKGGDRSLRKLRRQRRFASLPGLLYGDIFIASDQDTQTLRITLFLVTMLVLSLFLFSKRVTVFTAYVLGAVYVGWVGILIYGMTTAATAAGG